MLYQSLNPMMSTTPFSPNLFFAARNVASLTCLFVSNFRDTVAGSFDIGRPRLRALSVRDGVHDRRADASLKFGALVGTPLELRHAESENRKRIVLPVSLSESARQPENAVHAN
jgi:hypothetical protein